MNKEIDEIVDLTMGEVSKDCIYTVGTGDVKRMKIELQTLLEQERKRTLEEVKEVIDTAEEEEYEYFEILEEVEYFIKTGKNNVKLLKSN